MKLITNPYSLDDCKLEFDKNGYGHAQAKIMKVGALRYVDQKGETFFADVSLDELEKVKNTAVPIDITIRHPSNLLNPSDVQKNSHGTTLGKPQIKEIGGETWLVDGVILKTKEAISVAESGQLGTSAGYWRDAIKVDNGNVKFEDIVPNHLAIGCYSPRAKGAELFSLDSSDSDHGRIFETDTTKTPKKEVRMKRTVNGVKGQGFSLDDAKIEYSDENEPVVQKLVDREESLVKQFNAELDKQKASFDEDMTASKEKSDVIEGAKAALEQENTELKESMKNMISLDEVDTQVELKSQVLTVAGEIFGKGEIPEFKTAIDGVKAIVAKRMPNASFDSDDKFWGAYEVIKGNPKDNADVKKSNEALKKASGNKFSLDSDDRKYKGWDGLKIATNKGA